MDECSTVGKVKDLEGGGVGVHGVPGEEVAVALCCGKVKEDGAFGGEVANVEAGFLRETEHRAFFEGCFTDAEASFALDAAFNDAAFVNEKGAVAFKREGGVTTQGGVFSEVPGVGRSALAPIAFHALGDILLEAKASTFNKDGAKRQEGVACKDDGSF